ncbi:MAG: SGNH/GDSL hydrolase family protein [Eubacteriales bacterium]
MDFISILSSPLELRGLALAREGCFWRLPAELIDKVNDGVTGLAKNTAGARVRFRTASPSVHIRFTLTDRVLMNHFPLSGSSGADALFTFGGKTYYGGCVRPADGNTLECEGVFGCPNYSGELSDVVMNLPLYNGISKMELAADDGFSLEPPAPYRVERPVVFYGSSITQGGCASHPSSCYTARAASALGCDHINLGFSGSARGEESIARYIASLDMSAFVLDYDHNAPDTEHLRATHAKFFDIIRESQPDLPVIIMTKPDFDDNIAENSARRAIIRETYDKAVAGGDKNVRFCDGQTFFGTSGREYCTVDRCHPNDLGFAGMADAVYKALSEFI